MDDCRYLERHALRVDGHALRARAAREDGATAVHELGDARLERTMLPGGMVERLRLAGGARAELRLGADLAPMLAVRGFLPLPDPSRVRQTAIAGGLRWEARGADGVLRTTTVAADPPPAAVRHDGILELQGDTTLRYRFEPAGTPAPPEPARPEVRTDDPAFDALLRRALDDLRLLRSHLDGRVYYAAGVPWYATLFGRDAIITAHQTIAFGPDVAADTLRLLAARLGRRDDPVREEDPGKVLHELRAGEAAVPGATPLARYYGTVDATPLFLCLLAEHADWTGDLSLLRELRPEVDAMLAWLDGPADRDGDGLLDYAARAPGGLRNQGWKDSPDGVPDDRGEPLEPPVALIEAQAYAVRARREMARLLEADGDARTAAGLRAAADAHGRRLERFRVAGRRHYAMALGRDGPASSLGSNQGHLLWAGVLAPERAADVRNALMGKRMFSGWGIRTLAAGEPGYAPGSYHRGSVWPHDTAMAAAGLRASGFDDDFVRIFDGLLDAAAAMPGGRLPELFGGQPREPGEGPVPFPVACRPQAWAAGSLPALLTAGLGLRPDGLRGRIVAGRPALPERLSRVEVEGLRVAGGAVRLVLERRGVRAAWCTACAETDGAVRIEPASQGRA